MGQSRVPEPPDKITGWIFDASAILDISIDLFIGKPVTASHLKHHEDALIPL
jgi:hypothetical protein